jgi:hypothetical protein
MHEMERVLNKSVDHVIGPALSSSHFHLNVLGLHVGGPDFVWQLNL